MTDNAYAQADAQMQSILEMVAALDVDYDRLEELRENKAAQSWAANWSLAGCLPDNDPLLSEDADDARTALYDELIERADSEAETLDHIRENIADFDAETERRTAECERLYREAADYIAAGNDSVVVNGWHFWITDDVYFEDADELAELEEAAGDCESRDDAEQLILEDALSVEVRSDWHAIDDGEDEPVEFRIVLCTGGPHVQIRGELKHGEPIRAWLEYCDWGTPMTERCNAPGDEDALLAYASCFSFGE